MSALNFPSSPTLNQIYTANGKSWRWNGTSWVTYNLASGIAVDYILLQDQQTSGTASGTFTSGAWQTRSLNTKVTDVGNWCSLASNQFTLVPGTYRILARAAALCVNNHLAKLYNVTDAADVLFGTSEYSAQADLVASYSTIVGRFTITGAKVFEIRHRCNTTQATFGFGPASSLGTEIRVSVELWRESAVLLGSEYKATQNVQTDSYTLVADDAYKTIHMNKGTANDLTVPPNSSVPFAIGTRIPIWQIGAGQTTLVAGSGVTINSRGAALKIAGQYGSAMLEKQATDVWLATGDLTT